MSLIIENILDLIENYGEDEVNMILSDFSCPINSDIETFLKDKAIVFAKQKIAVTYIVSDGTSGKLLGYFSLANKAIQINDNAIESKTLKNRIHRFSSYDKDNGYTVPVYLLAQLGKNYNVEDGESVHIEELMSFVYCVCSKIQHLIGGSLIYLDVDCKNEKLIDLYHDSCGFVPFGKRISSKDGKTYKLMIKYLPS